MKTYDEEKLRRLRNRRKEIASNLLLASADMREHIDRVRDAQKELDQLKSFAFEGLAQHADDPVDHRQRRLDQAKAALAQAKEGQSLCRQRMDRLDEQQQSIGSLVTRLEAAIKSWGLRVPQDDHINSPNTRERTRHDRETY